MRPYALAPERAGVIRRSPVEYTESDVTLWCSRCNCEGRRVWDFSGKGEIAAPLDQVMRWKPRQ